ncbi:hypothetical protein QBC37DRAFT_370219 [Rhypophila decipiens]|uniref:Tudor domain-containing protein n=1 Tax=Rhypophila decipiens TaxID=261697 RepID=A0AAN6YDG1_9PEZI|nr:hypothetical protein QBC37DRAFT_370219 [Rhypophila decipiens]
MSDLIDLEDQLRQWDEQLELVNASLVDAPDNDELLELKGEIVANKQETEAAIAEAKAAAAAASVKKTDKKPQEKWSRENHPAFKKAAEEVVPEPAVVIKYAVNDDVVAKWLSGDKGFYPARITSITGSSTDPVYTVKFKVDGSIETLRSKDIRPPNNTSAAATTNPAAKRKADLLENIHPASGSASPAGGFSPIAGGSNNGVVVQKAAEKYPSAETAKKDDDKPKPKFKKMKPTKELEANKSNWQNFNAKGKFGKAGGITKKKESMFRVPEGVNARVGFTGSGQAMRKDVTRSRHVYQVADDDN